MTQRGEFVIAHSCFYISAPNLVGAAGEVGAMDGIISSWEGLKESWKGGWESLEGRGGGR